MCLPHLATLPICADIVRTPHRQSTAREDQGTPRRTPPSAPRASARRRRPTAPSRSPRRSPPPPASCPARCPRRSGHAAIAFSRSGRSSGLDQARQRGCDRTTGACHWYVTSAPFANAPCPCTLSPDGERSALPPSGWHVASRRIQDARSRTAVAQRRDRVARTSSNLGVRATRCDTLRHTECNRKPPLPADSPPSAQLGSHTTDRMPARPAHPVHPCESSTRW